MNDLPEKHESPLIPDQVTASTAQQKWQDYFTRWGGIASAGFVVLLFSCVLSYLIGVRIGKSEKAALADSEATLWTCSMHPQVQLPAPGKCPICFMDLIPLEKGKDSGPRSISMSLEAVALANIRTSPVRRQFVTKEVAMVGKVDYDETKVANITAWVPGRLDKLFIDYTGVAVRKGDHLGEIYSPDLIVAQTELIQSWTNYQKYGRERKDDLLLQTLKSSEEKLKLLGLKDEQIKALKKRGTVEDHLTIYSPIAGVVIHKNVKEGVYVKTGDRIYTIADISQVWVYMDAYESDVSWLAHSQNVEFTTETYPGKVFKGSISFIDPILNEKTRTVKVRVVVPNTEMKLKPGMFIRGIVRSRLSAGGVIRDKSLAGKWISRHHPEIIRDGPGKCPICGIDLIPIEQFWKQKPNKNPQPPLVIPATAPLITGKRAVVYVQIDPLLVQYEHILNWKELVDVLHVSSTNKQPTAVKRVWEFIDPAVRKLIPKKESILSMTPVVKQKVVDELNEILSRRDFYDPKAWNGIKLSKDIKTINQKSISHFTTKQLKLVNRRLIEAALSKLLKEAISEPTFQGREVLLGDRAGDFFIVRYGLSEGEKVVVSGNFKIDSALQINAKPSMMSPSGGGSSSGHNHGDSPKKSSKNKDEHTGHQSKKIDLPKGFRKTLTPVYQEYIAVSEALSQDDLNKTHLAAKKLIAAMNKINPEMLDGEGRKQWKSLKDKILIAAYETSDAKRPKTAREHFQKISNPMISLAKSFGHMLDTNLYQIHCPMAFDNKGASWLQAIKKTHNPYFGSKMFSCGKVATTIDTHAPFVVPDSFRLQLHELYSAYLNLQVQLAGDKLPKSAAATVTLQSELSRINPAVLDARGKYIWSKVAAQLNSTMKGDLKQDNIGQLRTRFHSISLIMIDMVERFGHIEKTPLVKIHCSMAFNKKGAPWLQIGKNVANPYYGAEMPSCGNLKRIYKPMVKKPMTKEQK